MKGTYNICVKNARLQYKLTINRNITILRGDSATGKTTLIDMIASYQANGLSSGITVECDKQCFVLTSFNWQLNLQSLNDSIIFIDEGEKFITSQDFAEAIKGSDNYYVIATRNNLNNLPYSIKEIYGIKNKSANRFQGTKRLYSEFYPLYKTNIDKIDKPDLVIVEDSNSGFEFFKHYFNMFNIECISAFGKTNIYRTITQSESENILVIADGAAFGCEIDSLIQLKKVRNLIIYLPESFEWLILKSDLFNNNAISDILNNSANYIDSKLYFSWEQFFTKLLIDKSNGTYLKYTKKTLNLNYCHKNIYEKIIKIMPNIDL